MNKTWVRILVLLTSTYAFLLYSPFLVDVEPFAYNIPFKDFTGPLAENYELSKAEHLFTNELLGPESIVFHKGYMYTGISDGRIIKVKDDKMTTVARTGRSCSMPYQERQCGRPLGMRVGKDDLLYVIDAFFGIFTLNFTTEILTNILPIDTVVDGLALTFPDDLDLDDDGNIYFTDASTKWALDKIFYLMYENLPNGRVIRFNMHSGETEVIVSGLHFPNGVQLTKDKNSLLINELMSRRIMRHYLKGEKKGKTEVFADQLPGEPDNIRPGSRGYWVGLTSARNSSTRNLADLISEHTLTKKLYGRMHYTFGSIFMKIAEWTNHHTLMEVAYKFLRGDYILHLFPRHGIILELNENGEILRSLQSPDAKTCDLSEVREHDGYLYLGSFVNNYLGKLKL